MQRSVVTGASLPSSPGGRPHTALGHRKGVIPSEPCPQQRPASAPAHHPPLSIPASGTTGTMELVEIYEPALSPYDTEGLASPARVCEGALFPRSSPERLTQVLMAGSQTEVARV